MLEPQEQVILSLAPLFMELFLNGRKCVELRRKPLSISSGTAVWMYCKLPTGKLMAKATLSSMEVDDPVEIWRKYSDCLGLTKVSFEQYLENSSQAAILKFRKIEAISNPVNLSELRALDPNFRPPQFYQRIRQEKLLDHLGKLSFLPSQHACAHC